MTLNITMKPKKPVEEEFESATLYTDNSAMMEFKKIGNYVRMADSAQNVVDGFNWTPETLRELADACQQIANILDKQND